MCNSCKEGYHYAQGHPAGQANQRRAGLNFYLFNWDWVGGHWSGGFVFVHHTLPACAPFLNVSCMHHFCTIYVSPVGSLNSVYCEIFTASQVLTLYFSLPSFMSACSINSLCCK